MSDPITNLHYSPNGNIVNGQYAPGADGFNLADVSSVSELNALPAGVKGLVYLGMGSGATASFQSTVSQYIGNPNLYGFYLVDEPDPSQVSAANLMAESDWIHANVPGAQTFIVLQNMGTDTNPIFNYNPANTHIDLFGVDPYPIQSQFSGGANYNIIPEAVAAAEAQGIPQADIVPVYQAFGNYAGGDWNVPTAAQEQQILSTWGSVVPTPAFDYAYSWGSQSGDTSLSGDAALQQVFATHNALGSGGTGSGGTGSGGTGSGGSTGGTGTGGTGTGGTGTGGTGTGTGGTGTGTGGTGTGSGHHHHSGSVSSSASDPSGTSGSGGSTGAGSGGSSGSGSGSGSASGGEHHHSHHHDVLNTGSLGAEMQSLAQGLAGTTSSGQSSTAGDPPAPTPQDPPAGSKPHDSDDLSLKSLGHHALSLLGADDDNAINTLLNGLNGGTHGHKGHDAPHWQVANVPDVGGNHDTIIPDLSHALAHGHHFEHLWS